MGRCAEFGPLIGDGCEHPMVAGAAACACAECGVECTGRFRGCAAVWARGPVELPPVRRATATAAASTTAMAGKAANGVEHPASEPEPPAAPPPPPAPAPVPAGDRISGFLSTVADLRADLRRLHDLVEPRSKKAAVPDETLQRLGDLVEELPARVSAAVMGALADVAAARTAERAMAGDNTIEATAAPGLRPAAEAPATAGHRNGPAGAEPPAAAAGDNATESDVAPGLRPAADASSADVHRHDPAAAQAPGEAVRPGAQSA